MKKAAKILGIIPARGSSKTLPRKNIRFLNGRPLIFYTISEALKSGFLDKVVVSTENSIIAKIARKYGAEVIRRPSTLAKDTTPTSSVILHALDKLGKKGYTPDVVVLLQPTSPLRRVHHIDEAIKIFLENPCDFVVSVCRTKKSPYWCFTYKGNFLKPLIDNGQAQKRRQELPPTYILNGAIFIFTPDKLLRNELNYFNGRTLPYFMHPEESIDIDDEIDLILAGEIMKRQKL